MQNVHVNLPGRAYDIRIADGLLTRAGLEIAPLLQRPRVSLGAPERASPVERPDRRHRTEFSQSL